MPSPTLPYYFGVFILGRRESRTVGQISSKTGANGKENVVSMSHRDERDVPLVTAY